MRRNRSWNAAGVRWCGVDAQYVDYIDYVDYVDDYDHCDFADDSRPSDDEPKLNDHDDP